MLARSPSAFLRSSGIRDLYHPEYINRPPYFTTNRGLELKIAVPMPEPSLPAENDVDLQFALIGLRCYNDGEDNILESDLSASIHVLLVRDRNNTVFTRIGLPFHITGFSNPLSDLDTKASSSNVEFCTITVSALRRMPWVDYKIELRGACDKSVLFNIDQPPSLLDIGLTARRIYPSSEPSEDE